MMADGAARDGAAASAVPCSAGPCGAALGSAVGNLLGFAGCTCGSSAHAFLGGAGTGGFFGGAASDSGGFFGGAASESGCRCWACRGAASLAAAGGAGDLGGG